LERISNLANDRAQLLSQCIGIRRGRKKRMKHDMRKFTIFGVGLGFSTVIFQGFAGSVEISGFDRSSRQEFGWEVVNDGVMGGLSKGSIVMAESGTMVFRGVLSLENDGGFSSVRSGEVQMDLSGAKGVVLRVRGDGRTYQFRLMTDARVRDRRVAFTAPLQTNAGQWAEVRVPFAAFKGTWRGEPVNEALLDPSKIQGFGFQLSDKKPGAFSLEVDWMKTYTE